MGGVGLETPCAASSSSPWQEELLPCWLHSKGVAKVDGQLTRTCKSRSGKEQRIYCAMVNVRFYREKEFCLQYYCGTQTRWWEALSQLPLLLLPTDLWSSGCGGAQRVAQYSPRAMETSLSPFISDLVTSGNEKTLGWLDFQ